MSSNASQHDIDDTAVTAQLAEDGSDVNKTVAVDAESDNARARKPAEWLSRIGSLFGVVAEDDAVIVSNVRLPAMRLQLMALQLHEVRRDATHSAPPTMHPPTTVWPRFRALEYVLC